MNEIEVTRVGHLGSSDADMVVRIAKRGYIDEADKPRIAQMLGLVVLQKVETPSMRLGHELEDYFFSVVKEKYGDSAVSNPRYVSKKITPKHFKVINHIDVEVEASLLLTWVEHKATKHQSIDEVYKKYYNQLQWHWMLLREKAEENEQLPTLKLAWYDTQRGEFSYANVDEDTDVIELIRKGIEIIDRACENFEWSQPEELPVEAMPDSVQVAISNVSEALAQIEKLNELVDAFKQKMVDAMLSNNIKSIKNDYISITLVNESTSVTFDKKKFSEEHPELAKQYERISKKKPYIIIKTKL